MKPFQHLGSALSNTFKNSMFLNMTPSSARSQMARALLAQSMEPNKGSKSIVESLNIASKPILASLLNRREEKAQAAQAEQQKKLAEQLLGGVRQGGNISIEDPTGGPASTTQIKPQLSPEEQKRQTLAAVLSQNPQAMQSIAMSQLPQPEEAYTLGPNEKRMKGGTVIAENNVDARDPEKLSKLVNDITDDLQKESSGFLVQQDFLGRLRQSVTDPSPAGDMSAVFAYMKILDPTSVVKEGEYAMAENARGVPASILNLYNKILEGQRLTPDQRADFANRAERLYAQSRADQGRRNDRFLSRAKSLKVPDEVITPLLLPLDPSNVQGATQTAPKPAVPQNPGASQGPVRRVIP